MSDQLLFVLKLCLLALLYLFFFRVVRRRVGRAAHTQPGGGRLGGLRSACRRCRSA